MFDELIKFYHCESDLEVMDEHWQSDSYEERVRDIINCVEDVTGFTPSKNLRPVKAASFQVKESTTMSELQSVMKKITERFHIECFQCSIDRGTNTVHMLFDRLNHETAKVEHTNRSEQVALSVLLIKDLDLPRPKGADNWVYHFISSAYSDDPKTFETLHEEIKHARLGKRSYRLVCDIIKYMKLRCQGIVK